jgi:uncharacterized protein (DUF433 family)
MSETDRHRRSIVSAATVYAHIVQTPGTCGGRPRIDGHRVRVQDVAVEHDWQAMSPEEICQAHPGLTLAEVYSALAYYYDHREQILADLEEDRRYAEEFKRRFPNDVR